MNQRPRVGVGAYVIKNGRVVLGFRISGHASGTWSAPGGHVEFGEAPAVTASRETMEECGLDIPPSAWRLRAVTNDVFAENNTHYLTLAFVVRITSGEPVVNEPLKLREWRWFDLDDLPSPLIKPFENALASGFNLADPPNSPIVYG